MSGQNETPPPYPDLEDIKRQLLDAKDQIIQANNETAPVVQLATLSQDANYIKRVLLGAAVLFVSMMGALWTGFIHLDSKIEDKFLHLDNKIEHKVDYINSRIDAALSKEIERKQKAPFVLSPTQTNEKPAKATTPTPQANESDHAD